MNDSTPEARWAKAARNSPDKVCGVCSGPIFQIEYCGRAVGGAKYCGPCAVERHRESARQQWRKKADIAEGSIVTVECVKRYADDCELSFTYTRKKGGALRSVCDACKKRSNGKLSAKWAKENPDRVAAAKRRYRKRNSDGDPLDRRCRKYGVTTEWYHATLIRQGGKCGNPGCGKTEPGGRWNVWHIDHCHQTGQVRGLLCDACNKALGILRDDPDVIAGLRSYVESSLQLKLVV